MNVIEHALEQYLRSETAEDRVLRGELHALPLYRGWTRTTFLTPSGEFLFRDEEDDPGTIRSEADHTLQLLAVVEGIERYPILVNLLPERGGRREDCADCHGTGRVYPRNATSWVYCGACHGLGWSHQTDWPLAIPDASTAPYPEFDQAVASFLSFALSQGLAGELVFISPEDAFFVRDALYVRMPDQTTARFHAKRAYATAARRRLGVAIGAAARLSETSFAAYVYGPEQSDEGERLMFPDGLKLSMPASIENATTVGANGAFALRLLCARSSFVNDVRERFK